MDREQTYWVRMRARLSDACQADPHWSEWSHVSGQCQSVLRDLKLTECIVLGACLCVGSCGSSDFPPQLAGDRPNFTWNTHDPPGSAAVGATPEVLGYFHFS